MNIDYIKGDERPTAALMNRLFGALDAKMTRLLGGRSFLLAQTATLPRYLFGKAFFFTAGLPVYATRVPGYLPMYPGWVMGQSYSAGDLVQDNGLNNLINPGDGKFYRSLANGNTHQPSQSTGYWAQVSDVQRPRPYQHAPFTKAQAAAAAGALTYDQTKKLAVIGTKLGEPYYAGLPMAADVGLFEWSLAAHSVWHQGAKDRAGATRYYLQDGGTTPEKHYRFALAEIILEGQLAATIEKGWDKYCCFRLHNLNAKAAQVTFADTGYKVNLRPFQCATVRRDLISSTAAEGAIYGNYRPGYNYFFEFESGDPRFYWFFPTAQTNDGGSHTWDLIGYSERAANSMQANNLTNPAMALDWITTFLRTPDNTSTFCGWTEDPTVQCDLRALDPTLATIYGDPSDPTTPVGDLLHHRGDIIVLRRPRQVYKLTGMNIEAAGEGYQPNDIVTVPGGLAITPGQGKVTSVDAAGRVTAISVYSGSGYNGYYYPSKTPPATGAMTGGSGKGLTVSLQYTVQNNDYLAGIYGLMERLKFNGYRTIVQDFGAAQITCAEDSNGNLAIKNGDPANDVFLFPIGTNLFKTGESLPIYVDLSGTNTVSIEYMVFDTMPESFVFTNDVNGGVPLAPATGALLTNTPSQIIVPPAAQKITPYKIYFDIYNPDPSLNLPPNQVQINGAPQEMISLTGGAGAIKLVSATIQDGGSGYAVGDVFPPKGGTAAYNDDGSPHAAQIEVTAVNRGRITAIQIVSGGGYTTAPQTPNSPTGGSGTGAILNLSFNNTFYGIHKKTVADLLTLDWWGDPSRPGQNTDYLVLEDRKIILTPEGPVLTWTERLAMGNFEAAGDFGNFSIIGYMFNFDGNWMGGKTAPRTRRIHFRGHGWGFVGATHGGVGPPGPPASLTPAIPPSGTSGIFSPTQGRKKAAGYYLAEIIGRMGRDFDESTWAFGQASEILLLQRVEPMKLQFARLPWTTPGVPLGRFWRMPGDNLWMFVDGLDAKANTAAYSIPGSSTAVPTITMNLAMEMYNALARAINSITGGTPLSWQCLRFNCQGVVMSLDPTFGPGTGNTTFAGATTPQSFNYYTGPKPMNQFCAFDPGSMYEALMAQLGVIVQREADLPGNDDLTFLEIQKKTSAPAVYCETVHSTVIGATAHSTPIPDVYLPGDGGVVLSTVPLHAYMTMTSQTTVATELLSTAKLLAGKPTGSGCLGTYNPTQYTQGGGPPGHTVPPYPDFSAAPYGYYVAEDGSGMIATAGGQQNAFNGATITPGWAWMPDGATVVDLTYFHDYRWVGIEEIRRVVTAFGFEFLWTEVCMPLELRYFEDPTVQMNISGTASVERTSNSEFDWEYLVVEVTYPGGLTQITNLWPTNSYDQGYPWSKDGSGDRTKEAQLLATPAVFQILFNNSGMPGHGTLIKFCPTASAGKARWKYQAKSVWTQLHFYPPSPAFGGNATVSGGPEICDVAPARSLSPFFRYVYDSGLGIDGYAEEFPWITGSGTKVAPFPPDRADVAQLLVHYTGATQSDELDALQAGNYSEGQYNNQKEYLAFNLYSTQPLQPLLVQMHGANAWRRPVDCWGSRRVAFAAQFPHENEEASHVSWTFIGAAPSWTQTITQGLDGTGNGGVTIVAPPRTDSRYYCLFDAGQMDLGAVTF